MIEVTKSQLKRLNEQVGKLNSDSGAVFIGVRGAHNPATGLFEVEVNERPLELNELAESFSLTAILEAKDH